MEEITIVGVDLAKSVFQVHATVSDGRGVIRKRLPRTRFLSFMSQVRPCVVAMEACATSHHWARELTALGHDVRLIPPIYVKPFVKRQKNDANDAEAIAEAAMRPSMRTVPVKSPEQQALAMLFRTRELLLTQKAQLVNALRAHLAEHGVIVAGGRRSIDPFIRVLDDVTNALPPGVRKVGAIYLDRIARTAGEIEDLERQIDEQAKEHEMAQRLRTIPGVGPVTAMAIEALMTVVKPNAHDFFGACFPSGVLRLQDAVSRMPELQRRLIKLLSARQGRIPACVASSRFCRARIRRALLSNHFWGIL